MIGNPLTALAHDPDLAALSKDQARGIADQRLAQFTVQLYEALLNRANAEVTEAPAATKNEQDNFIAGLRKAIHLHRDEIAAIDAKPPLTKAS